jgi:hypothetical protein
MKKNRVPKGKKGLNCSPGQLRPLLHGDMVALQGNITPYSPMQHGYSLGVTMCIWDQNINFLREFVFLKEQKVPQKTTFTRKNISFLNKRKLPS